MQVILLDKVAHLGNVGDQVEVKAGFARNFLIPQGKAVMATKENVAHFQARRAELEAKAAEKLALAQKRADELTALGVIAIVSNAGEDGRLFGSVGARDISAAVSKAGVALEKSEVRLGEGPLRNLGEFEVRVQLHPEVSLTLNVSVVAEG